MCGYSFVGYKYSSLYRVLVVVLNWNGWEDKIPCCETLLASYGPIDILLLDNGSEDQSVDKIHGFLRERASKYRLEKASLSGYNVVNYLFVVYGCNVVLSAWPENLGFAGGCNAALKYASAAGYKYTALLSNDTTVTASALEIMRSTLERSGADIVIPQIRYFSQPDIICNCGGEISIFGRVRYYHAEKDIRTLMLDQEFKVGFGTGCCMIFRTSFFLSINGFTERFFFGEEDVDLSYRLKGLKRSIVCEPRAVIFHKVSASVRGDSNFMYRKTFIHYLNRFINVRSQLPRLVWHLWRSLTLMKVAFNLKRNFHKNNSEILFFIGELFRASGTLDGVSKKYFKTVMSKGVRAIHE